jgi:hypothetical protein
MGCNSLASDDAPVIHQIQIAEASPPMNESGGMLGNGTYYMTASTYYTGVGGPTGPTDPGFRRIMVVSDATPTSANIQWVEWHDDTMFDYRSTYVAVFSTTTATATFSSTCPTSLAAVNTYKYSIDADEVVFRTYDAFDTYTKQ